MKAPATPPAAFPLARRDAAAMALLVVAVAAFHLVMGRGVGQTVLLQSFNWLFDFDSSRFVATWCSAEGTLGSEMDISFIARHALAVLGRPLCLPLEPLAGSPQQALMAFTALCAGLTAAVAYAIASPFCESPIDRTLAALAYAVSAQPLLLGVIPEMYGWALAGVALHFALLARAGGAPLPARWPAAVSVFLNAGITVTNGVLNLVSAAILSAPRAGPARPAPRGDSSKVAEPHLLESWRRLPPAQWLKREAGVWAAGLLLLLVVAGPLTALYAPAVAADAGDAPRRVWWIININRGEAATLWEVVRALVGYSFVAPEAVSIALPDPDNHPMLDFRAANFGALGWLAWALWAAALAASVAWARTHEGGRRLLAVVGTWLLLNIVLHWFWQYRGSVWLYGAHSGPGLFMVLCIGYGAALAHWPRAAARGAAVLLLAAVAVHNFGIYRHTIGFLLGGGAAQ